MTPQRLPGRLTGPKRFATRPSGETWYAFCKICRRRIEIGEPRVWLTSPMGLSRQDCARRAAA